MKGSKLNQLKKNGKETSEQSQNFKKKGAKQEHALEEEMIDDNGGRFSDSDEDEWEEETLENDEGDEYIEEDDQFEEEEMEVESPEQTSSSKNLVVPFMGGQKDLQAGEYMEYSNRAYKMLHRCATEWPVLSVDFIADAADFSTIAPRDFSIAKKDFDYPVDVYAVGGSQAEEGAQNSLYLLRFAQLGLTKYDDDEDADESFEEQEPRLFYARVPQKAGTNRARTLMNTPVVAIMNDNAQLQVHDLRTAFAELKARDMSQPLEIVAKPSIVRQFMLPAEGFALDFSPLTVGRLACGTVKGQIFVVDSKDANLSDLVKSDAFVHKNQKSIEDIQFSPNQNEVLAACSTDGTVRIFDLRAPAHKGSELLIEAHDCDVNVISWNKKAPTLIASGADDGSFKVWDLRYIGKPAITHILWHKEPITSLEWQPHDEWTLAAGSADNRLSIWDFSVEKDDEEALNPEYNDIPEQLLFVHQGQEDLKELRWHPVYSDVLISTALDGFNVFQPAIDENISSVDSPNDLELIPDQVE